MAPMPITDFIYDGRSLNYYLWSTRKTKPTFRNQKTPLFHKKKSLRDPKMPLCRTKTPFRNPKLSPRHTKTTFHNMKTPLRYSMTSSQTSRKASHKYKHSFFDLIITSQLSCEQFK